jgi:hypothetical protein
MLAAKWKAGAGTQTASEAPKPGQVRSFRIAAIDPAQKKIELDLA